MECRSRETNVRGVDGWRYVWFPVFETFFLAALFVLTFGFVADDVEAAIFAFRFVGRTFDAAVVFFSTAGKGKGAVACRNTWKCSDNGRKHDKSRDEVFVKHVGRSLVEDEMDVRCGNTETWASFYTC